MTEPRLSVVVPAYNESESLPELHRELVAALGALHMSWELLDVDDGSREGPDRVIERLCAEDERVRGILLLRNFGKSAALATGFKAVRGEFVCTLDADLQDDPSELPKLFAALEQGYDVVSGWKVKRRDPITKRWPSKLFNAVTSSVAGVRLHDFNCRFKLYRREAGDALEGYGQLHRFLPALSHWPRLPVGGVAVHQPAPAGGGVAGPVAGPGGGGARGEGVVSAGGARPPAPAALGRAAQAAGADRRQAVRPPPARVAGGPRRAARGDPRRARRGVAT